MKEKDWWLQLDLVLLSKNQDFMTASRSETAKLTRPPRPSPLTDDTPAAAIMSW